MENKELKIIKFFFLCVCVPNPFHQEKNKRKLFLMAKSTGPLLAGLPHKRDFYCYFILGASKGVNLNGANEWTVFVSRKVEPHLFIFFLQRQIDQTLNLNSFFAADATHVNH